MPKFTTHIEPFTFSIPNGPTFFGKATVVVDDADPEIKQIHSLLGTCTPDPDGTSPRLCREYRFGEEALLSVRPILSRDVLQKKKELPAVVEALVAFHQLNRAQRRGLTQVFWSDVYAYLNPLQPTRPLFDRTNKDIQVLFEAVSGELSQKLRATFEKYAQWYAKGFMLQCLTDSNPVKTSNMFDVLTKNDALNALVSDLILSTERGRDDILDVLLLCYRKYVEDLGLPAPVIEDDRPIRTDVDLLDIDILRCDIKDSLSAHPSQLALFNAAPAYLLDGVLEQRMPLFSKPEPHLGSILCLNSFLKESSLSTEALTESQMSPS